MIQISFCIALIEYGNIFEDFIFLVDSSSLSYLPLISTVLTLKLCFWLRWKHQITFTQHFNKFCMSKLCIAEQTSILDSIAASLYPYMQMITIHNKNHKEKHSLLHLCWWHQKTLLLFSWNSVPRSSQDRVFAVWVCLPQKSKMLLLLQISHGIISLLKLTIKEKWVQIVEENRICSECH